MDIAALRHTFASRIRKLRDGKMNQGEFADSVGISRGAMSYYEQESRTPDIGVLRAICVKYNVSADYLLGITADPSHEVADVCRETGLAPQAAKTLNLISRLIDAGELESYDHFFDYFGDDFHEMLKVAAYTSLPEVLNILIANSEGRQLLTMLGAIILGAEVDSGGENIVVRIKSASKNFEIAYPVKNITASLWVNIQDNANKLREQYQTSSPKPE